MHDRRMRVRESVYKFHTIQSLELTAATMLRVNAYQSFLSRCDIGFDGAACENPLGSVIRHLIDPITDRDTLHSNFQVVKGASLSYNCGVVSSGKAVVFHKSGLRQLQTRNTNTTGLG